MNRNIVVVGLVLLIVIVFLWSNALSDITVGKLWGGTIFVGNSASQAAAQRSNTNTSYGLYAALVLIGTPVLAHLYGKKGKKDDDDKGK